MIVKFLIFSVVVIVLGTASYVFVSTNIVQQKGQIVITDEDITTTGEAVAQAGSAEDASADVESVTVQGTTDDGTTRMLGDLSTVTATSDGWGNVTETRVFRSHSRLRMVMVQTLADGSKRAYVYGHLGGVKTLRGTDANLVLSAGADEIANKAEIFETRLDKSRRLPNFASTGAGDLRPLDSSEIEINTPEPEGTKEATSAKVSEEGKSAEGI